MFQALKIAFLMIVLSVVIFLFSILLVVIGTEIHFTLSLATFAVVAYLSFVTLRSRLMR